MSGLWNRLTDRGEMDDPLGGRAVKAIVYLVGRGLFTGAQARGKLDSTLRVPLTAAEIADLTALLGVLAAQPNATAKLDYLERVDALSICAERKLVTEAQWRSELGIQ